MVRFDSTPWRAVRTRFHVAARLAVATLLAFAVAGCSLFPEVKDETAGWSADRLYQTAHDAMLQGNYQRAIKLFDQLEARYPYGRYAQQAILESAYSNWRGNETEAAVAAADRFIRTYPNHPNVDYAYYLKGLVYFREDQGLIGYVYELDLSERDPKEMRSSFAAFKELSTKFPDSQYTQDALARMRYLNNAMATYEYKVARYYFNRGAYVAAANRAQGVLVNFPQTPANDKALDLLYRSYARLDLTQLADDSKAILVKTFPESPYVTGVKDREWWEFWKKDEASFGVEPTGQWAERPWWQFW
ncbi:MAG: outer membrane protein assembly factor BamD [Burkholderiales bacterium]|nr:outer membrane protein assembly factor BamD [Burkholderiales bacterium]